MVGATPAISILSSAKEPEIVRYVEWTTRNQHNCRVRRCNEWGIFAYSPVQRSCFPKRTDPVPPPKACPHGGIAAVAQFWQRYRVALSGTSLRWLPCIEAARRACRQFI